MQSGGLATTGTMCKLVRLAHFAGSLAVGFVLDQLFGPADPDFDHYESKTTRPHLSD